jgi:hypothetical protein
VWVGLTIDNPEGSKPKGAIAISQMKEETPNSIINRSDDQLRLWYLENKGETVQECLEEGKFYDDDWVGMVWELEAAGVDNALGRLNQDKLVGVLIERDD